MYSTQDTEQDKDALSGTSTLHITADTAARKRSGGQKKQLFYLQIDMVLYIRLLE